MPFAHLYTLPVPPFPAFGQVFLLFGLVSGLGGVAGLCGFRSSLAGGRGLLVVFSRRVVGSRSALLGVWRVSCGPSFLCCCAFVHAYLSVLLCFDAPVK